MDEVIDLGSPLLVEAIRLWTGYGISAAPYRNDERLTNRFGTQSAAKILLVIKAMEKEFYSSDAQFRAKNLKEMEEMVSEDYRRMRPEVAEEVIKVLAWCYSFDFR